MKILKWVLITLGGLFAALVLLLTAVALFAPEGDTSIAYQTVGDKTIRLYAKGNTGFESTVSGNEMRIKVYDRTIHLKGDGTVTVDDQLIETPPFKELAVHVHPDKRVETVVVQGP